MRGVAETYAAVNLGGALRFHHDTLRRPSMFRFGGQDQLLAKLSDILSQA
jgi:hypothetical protein